MTKRFAALLLVVLAGLVAGAAILLRLRSAGIRPTHAAASARPAAPPLPRPPAEGSASVAPELTRVTLFFLSPQDGLLRPEERDLPKAPDEVTAIRRLFDAEVAGPRTPGLLAALPKGVVLRNTFPPQEGLVVVDLSVDAEWARRAGSDDEMTVVAAAVDVVLQNVAGTDRVRILVNGNDVETLAGHVDISRPLAALRDSLSPGPARE